MPDYYINIVSCGPTGHAWSTIADGARCICGAQRLEAQEREDGLFFHIEDGGESEGIYAGNELLELLDRQ